MRSPNFCRTRTVVPVGTGCPTAAPISSLTRNQPFPRPSRRYLNTLSDPSTRMAGASLSRLARALPNAAPWRRRTCSIPGTSHRERAACGVAPGSDSSARWWLPCRPHRGARTRWSPLVGRHERLSFLSATLHYHDVVRFSKTAGNSRAVPLGHVLHESVLRCRSPTTVVNPPTKGARLRVEIQLDLDTALQLHERAGTGGRGSGSSRADADTPGCR